MNKKIILIGFINCIILAVVALFLIKRGNPEPHCPIVVQLEKPIQAEWRLMKSMDIDLPNAKFIALSEQGIYVADGETVLLYNAEGRVVSEHISYSDEKITAIAFLQAKLLVAKQGLLTWGDVSLNLGEKSYITDVAMLGNQLVIADAGQAKLILINEDGEQAGEISSYEEQGFKIPSPYFSLSASEDGELWVSDPGRKCFVHYDAECNYRAHWEPQSELGFLGCCNPARMRCLPNGQFLTLEKGKVRVRIFEPSGTVECVIADLGEQQNFCYDMAFQDDTLILLDGKNQKIHFYQKN